MSSNIMDAIKAAQKAAANIPQEAAGNANLPATAPAAALPGPALGLAQMLQGGMSVDHWLKVNEYGITFGMNRSLFDKVKLQIDLSEVGYCYCIRYGNPATYEKSYDHVTNVRGGTWAETIVRARQVDPKASEYRSADLPFVAVEDIKDSKGQVVVEKGKKVGHSLSLTGWKSWVEFAKNLAKAGINPENAVITLELGFIEQKNNKGTWGVLTFNNAKEVAPFDTDEAEAA